MIDEKTIEHLLDLLDTAVVNFHNGTNPGRDWVEDVNWLVFDLRRDLDFGRFMFDWMISPEKANALRQENYRLDEENTRLQNELDEAPDQDEFNELAEENEELRKRISELEDKYGVKGEKP